MAKRARWALGAMSGTSLDGVDAATILTDGHEVLEFGDTAYRAYSEQERGVIAAALGLWEGPEVARAGEVVEEAHAECLARLPEAEVIGFHGQTLAHDPARGRTLQVGDGGLLAETLDRTVVWDFRTNDVGLGGQGAPLVPFYHFALARRMGADAPLAVLNIGGVANLTWIDPRASRPEADGALLAFDTGPGNARLNDLMMVRRGVPMDEGGALASMGQVDEEVLERMLADRSYLSKLPPKSLDRNDFARFGAMVEALADEDAAATLTAATAATIAAGLEHCPSPPERILVTGGGRLNPVLMAMIQGLVRAEVAPIEDAGFDGDMLEAQAFAYLAVRVLEGLPTTAPGTTGVPAPVGGGRVSRPGDLTRLVAAEA